MAEFYYSDGSALDYRDFNRILHRLDGPAAIYDDGEKHWYQNGLHHRLDGPAIIYVDSGQNGARHRVNKSTIDLCTKIWCQNGKLHRLNGPAAEHAGGKKQWYQNGERHRLDGPAITYADGEKYWYINDKQFTEEDFEKTILIMQLSGLLNG